MGAIIGSNQRIECQVASYWTGEIFYISSIGGSDESEILKIKEVEAQCLKKEQIMNIILTARGQKFSQ